MQSNYPNAAVSSYRRVDPPKVVPASEAARLVGLSTSTLAKLRLNGMGRLIASWVGGFSTAQPILRNGFSLESLVILPMQTLDS
jgi:hypothetical protein